MIHVFVNYYIPVHHMTTYSNFIGLHKSYRLCIKHLIKAFRKCLHPDKGCGYYQTNQLGCLSSPVSVGTTKNILII